MYDQQGRIKKSVLKKQETNGEDLLKNGRVGLVAGVEGNFHQSRHEEALIGAYKQFISSGLFFPFLGAKARSVGLFPLLKPAALEGR
jgi:hypothetical protein